jgi:phosphomannomutase
VRVLRYPDYIPTPLLAFSVLHLVCDAGVMVTASHNPPAYNGYKVYFADGTQISEEDAARVLALLCDDTRTGYHHLPYADYDEAVFDGRIRELGNETETVYLEEVLKLAQRIEPDGGGHVRSHDAPAESSESAASTPLRILYTPLSGTAGHRMLRLLQADGFPDVRTVASQLEPDPDFSNVSSPNPEFRTAFDRAEAEALASGADLVLATDPDGDRFTAMVPKPDGTYHHLTGNQTGAILTWYVLEGLNRQARLPAKAALVKTVVTDDLAAGIARAIGVHVHETLTGFKHICGDIPDLATRGFSYVLGYEESIGYAVGTLVRDKDGLSGGLLLCRAAAHLRHRGKTLWDLLTDLWTTYGYHAARPLNLVREGLDGQTEIAAILAAFRACAPRQVETARLVRAEDLLAGSAQNYSPDGSKTGPAEPLGFPRSNVLRFFFDDGSWYAIRPSGTEPKLKIYLYAVVKPAEPYGGRPAARSQPGSYREKRRSTGCTTRSGLSSGDSVVRDARRRTVGTTVEMAVQPDQQISHRPRDCQYQHHIDQDHPPGQPAVVASGHGGLPCCFFHITCQFAVVPLPHGSPSK